MSRTKRITIRLEPDIHRALRYKAAVLDQSISEAANAAIRHALAEDAADLKAFRERRKEPNVDFEDFVMGLHGSRF